MEQPTLYTIGHSNHDAATFLAHLRQHGIQTLVDVRSQPYSARYPHFNARELRYSLEGAGIGYEFYGGALGGRPGGVTHAWLNEDVRTRSYDDLMEREEFQEGIGNLISLLNSPHTDGGVAIMCSEGEPLDCHRHHLISHYLLRQGYAVEIRHIGRDGGLGWPLRVEDFELMQQRDLF